MLRNVQLCKLDKTDKLDCMSLQLKLVGPSRKLQRKSVMNRTPGAILPTLPFLHGLQMGLANSGVTLHSDGKACDEQTL